MMLTVCDIHLELQTNPSVADVIKLKDHLKASSINVVGLDTNDFKALTDELTFSIYGNIGHFMMKQMVQKCTQNIFPGCVIGFLYR